jgi:hypothetical protein
MFVAPDRGRQAQAFAIEAFHQFAGSRGQESSESSAGVAIDQIGAAAADFKQVLEEDEDAVLVG